MMRRWVCCIRRGCSSWSVRKGPKKKPSPRTTSALADIQVVTSPGGVTAWLVSENFVPIVAMEMAWEGRQRRRAPGQGWAWLGARLHDEQGAGETRHVGIRRAHGRPQHEVRPAA